MPSPIEEMRIVARRLQPLKAPFVFVGGAVVCLLVDHPELSEFRPTKDVDVIVQVVTYVEFASLEQRLRDAGFVHDTSFGAPICRWKVGGCTVDIMPENSASLGMNTKWFPEALALSRKTDLGEGCIARVITPPLFIATKLEAFKDRGKNDFMMSHDLEDIITVIDGRDSVVEEIAAAPVEVRRYLADWFSRLLRDADFQDALPGYLPGLLGARQRVPLILQRLGAISGLS